MKRLLFILLSWYLFVQGSELFPEPIYYTVYEDESVIIKYSREVYFDIYGNVYETTDEVYKKYENVDIINIEINIAENLILENNKNRKQKIKQILENI